jgi:hypothetical protein
MRTFKYRRDSWPAFRNRTLLGMLIGIPAFAVGAYVVHPRHFEWWYALVALIPFLLGTFRGLRRVREQWESFEISLDGDCVVRRQANTPEIRLCRSEVVSVTESPSKGLAIRGASRYQLVGASKHLEGYEELATVLREWGPPSPPSKAGPYFPALAGLATVVLFGIAFGAPNPAVAAVAAAVLAAGLLWCVVELRRNPHVDEKTRRIAWWALVPMAAAVARVVTVLAAGR